MQSLKFLKVSKAFAFLCNIFFTFSKGLNSNIFFTLYGEDIMKRHPFFYLGFLSFVSLFYFVTGNNGLFGFLGFLAYFSIYRDNDERLEGIVGRACKIGFLFLVFVGCACFIYLVTFEDLNFAIPAFMIVFAGTMFVTLVSYFWMVRR